MKMYTIRILLSVAAAACLALPIAAAQEKKEQQPPSPPTDDPFYRKPKPVPVRVEKETNKPVPIPFPTLEQRQQDYLRAKQEAKAKGLPDPDPIGQYLVSELNVTGVFETDTGVGAFVQAKPTNTTFFVAPGTRVYNGEIVSINTGQNFDLGQVVFRELTKYRVKKQEQDVVNVITKNVGPPTKKP